MLIGILEKMLEKNTRDWHRILSKTLWAYRSSIGVRPFSLTYGQDVVLQMELIVPSLRISKQNDLTPQDYSEAMMLKLKYADDRRMEASTICSF